ncbi:P-loop containing nucleoside triphosphate hydrolase [Sesbania bispinosa]|nr:P-loop containing nucleoside triphosphate hydrolase [Sesbania bispinosa]
MESRLTRDNLAMGRKNHRSWPSMSFNTVWTTPSPDGFNFNNTQQNNEHLDLQWAAIERLPTYDRMRKGVLRLMLDNGKVLHCPVDVTNLGLQDKKLLLESILKIDEEDNEKFLRGLRNRVDRVGIEIPKIEVRYENVSAEGDVRVGSRALPTLLNVILNTIENFLGLFRLAPSNKRNVQILKDVSGIIRPSRMTLLLGPPGAGKTTLLLALAGKLDRDLRESGRITYCGRCLGVGTRYEMLEELLRREREAGIKPDPEIDAFMKATAISGQEASLVTDYVLKVLGLDICADTMVGDNMRRGISGGQRKRVTTGEMLVGPAKTLFMDEISTGLDSSTTFQICKFMRQKVHIMDVTMVISLLQPAPETFELFDDIILLSEGQIVYQGPRENVLEFFENMGFKCPARKGVADFLQEVTSKKDQQQYWVRRDEPYRYVSVPEFAQSFHSFHIGEQLATELRVPYDKRQTHPAALVKDKTVQLTILAIFAFTLFIRTEMPVGNVQDGKKFFGALFYALSNMMFNGSYEQAMIVSKLPVFYKQRDFKFFPAWAFGLPIWILRIPLSLIEPAIWVCFTYYTIGFAPSATRFFRQYLAFFSIHHMAISLFRIIGAIGRTQVVATILSGLTNQVVFVLGGFVVAKNDIKPWMLWGYYVSPMSYGQNALVINEFLDERWNKPNTDLRIDEPTVGKVLLKSRGFYTEEYWFWISIGALIGFAILFNLVFIAALTYLNPLGDSKVFIKDENDKENKKSTSRQHIIEGRNSSEIVGSSNQEQRTGMVLPFQPLSLTFNHVNYYVDMPIEMKNQGINEDRLQLLHDVSGDFRPSILTALMGVSGAGKTTLMDVLAGRKTGGYIEGSISISGYPKNQATFARISGYCEQNDIHSPNVTVYESLLFSAWLRLPSDVKTETRKMFVEEIIDLIELKPIKDALVGLPGINGLSTEQRKRLTIAVELVANPSIVFMDEPTSGLDARAAAIVMRTVRNTVDTGRTVVCTIHQPSIDIFEAFDEAMQLLLMKRGGQIIYAGSLGHNSNKLIEYFEAITGVPKIKDGYNPATWMLEISTPSIETKLGVDFADIYASSSLYQRNQELIEELSTPTPGSKDLFFPTKYSQPYFVHQKQQDVFDLLGAMYSSVMFLGTLNAMGVQPIVDMERIVLYREKAAGMYSTLPYAFGQVAIEIIYTSIQAGIYTIVLYSMMGFEWKAGQFLWLYYFMAMCFIYFTLYGMMIVVLSPNYQVAMIFGAFFTNTWNLFSGFVIPRTQIPIWWRWYYWASPTAWTIYGLITSQLGDKAAQLEIPGVGTMELKKFLKESFGYDYHFLPVVAMAHVGWVLLFLFVFAYAMKFLNFQKR